MRLYQLEKQLHIPMIGVADLAPLDQLKALVQDRQAKENLSGFEPDLSQALEPHKAFPGGRTVFAIAIPYEMTNVHPALSPDHYGVISNMAWAYDYHQVVHRHLDDLEAWIEGKVPGAACIKHVDTGPLLDRSLAEMTGLGAYGRNQFLLTEDWGTATYLGYLITTASLKDLDLDPQAESKGHLAAICRDCNRCQVACPTGALHGERAFDGQKCLSTLTQTKRPLTYAERETIGLRLYGCDLCQQSCPANDKTLAVPDVYQRETSNRLDPFDLLGLSNKGFKKAYGDMGFAWRGASVLKRNALIAIGNRRQAEDIPRLLPYLDHGSPLVREYAAWAVMRIDPVQGHRVLAQRDDKAEWHWEDLVAYYLNKRE